MVELQGDMVELQGKKVEYDEKHIGRHFRKNPKQKNQLTIDLKLLYLNRRLNKSFLQAKRMLA